MRAILVDDELQPLQRLKKLIENNIENIEVIGTYLNPLEAEGMIKQLQPDIIFLDIEMPGLNGLQLGERIQEACPNIEIVFVTAFDKYAVQAFQLYAIDYIMKPIHLERLTMTVERVRILQSQRLSKEQSVVEIHPLLGCFHSLNLQWSDGKMETIKWRTAKAQELFAYLLHHRGQVIYRDTILELLWPDFDLARGSKQLYTTIYHIRQTLKNYGLEEITIGRQQLDIGYRLHMGTIQIDTDLWSERVVTATPPTVNTADVHEQLLLAYEGDYLGEHGYLWAEGERERLRRLWLNHAQRLSTFYIDNRMTHNAIQVNEHVQQRSPIEEISYFNLMQLYASQTNYVAVEDQYNQLKVMMAEQLDTTPSEQITSWFEQWKQTV
ncbi:response regulator [Sporosarcina sp. FSL K6-3457]|uniref:response regulator n=1 Tax=Sporosarcina sp. FSL K6-3457 TaxID=2978204 RepID=UPI0030FBADCA